MCLGWETCLLTIVVYVNLSTGHRDRGALQEIFKDFLERFLVTSNIEYDQ